MGLQSVINMFLTHAKIYLDSFLILRLRVIGSKFWCSNKKREVNYFKLLRISLCRMDLKQLKVSKKHNSLGHA